MLLPKWNTLGVVDEVCPKMGCVPLEVVEAGAVKGEGAVESFAVEDALFMLNEKVELDAPLEVDDVEGHAKVDLGVSAGLSDAVVPLVDTYPKADFVPVLGEAAGVVVPKAFDDPALVPNPPKPVFGAVEEGPPEALPPKGLDDPKPPDGTLNLNLGAALAIDGGAGCCGCAVDLFASGPELAGFVSAVAPGEAPLVGTVLGDELVGLLEMPKLNLGTGVVLGAGAVVEAPF